MGVDQYNNTYHNLTHPRKDLLNRLGATHAERMYVDKKDGTTVHVGYIIRHHWICLYEVTPFEKPVEGR